MIRASGFPGETVICIGTSPAMLLEGLWLARNGKKVTFVDNSEAIGGGWRTRDLFGFGGIEVGVHLFENRKATNRALVDILGPERVESDDTGFGLFGGRSIPLRPSRILLYAGLFAKAIGSGRHHQALHAARNCLASIRELRTPLIYPKGGIEELLSTLRTRLQDAGASFRLGTHIETIKITSDRVLARCKDGELIADMLILSSRAHAPVEGLEHLWTTSRVSQVTSLTMLMNESSLAFEGYVEILGHPFLKRVRRLEHSPPTSDRPVMIAQVRTCDKDLESLGREVTINAASLGLLHTPCPPRSVHLERVAYRTLPNRALRRISRESRGKIRVLRTIDFSDEAHRVKYPKIRARPSMARGQMFEQS